MTFPIWLVGCITTCGLVYLSWSAGRWWPLAYVFAIFFGMGTGLLLWSWPEQLRNAWWLLGMVYAVGLPIVRALRRRAEDREREAAQFSESLRAHTNARYSRLRGR